MRRWRVTVERAEGFREGQRVTVLPFGRQGVPSGFGFRGVVDMSSVSGPIPRGGVRVRFETPHAKSLAWFKREELAEGWDL